MRKPAFQLIASFIAMMMIGNLQYTWTLFVEPIRDANMEWKLSSIQAAYTIFILLQAWVQPVSGWFIDRVGQRPFITIAGLLCGIGWTGMGYATSLPLLKALYAMAGIGAAFVYSGSIGSAIKWFPNRRGFASGVIAAGYGGGAALSVWVVQHLIRDYNYRTAFILSGLVQGIVITLIAQVLRHPGPDFNPPKPVVKTASVPVPIARRSAETFTTREMLGTRHFYVLYCMFVAMGIGGVFLTASSGSLARSWGLADALTLAASLGLMANAASRPTWGWMSDRMGRENTMVVAFILQAVFLVGLVTVGKSSGLMFTLGMILVYFTWGEIYALFPSTVADYFGSKYATSNNSFLYSGKGVAAIAGIYLPQILFERLGSWVPVLYGSAVLALLSAITALVLRSAPLPKKTTQSKVASLAT
jgi:OFA family oxalate/formate antiporter-like MFS transporter